MVSASSCASFFCVPQPVSKHAAVASTASRKDSPRFLFFVFINRFSLTVTAASPRQTALLSLFPRRIATIYKNSIALCGRYFKEFRLFSVKTGRNTDCSPYSERFCANVPVKQIETGYRRETLCSCKAAKGTHRAAPPMDKKDPPISRRVDCSNSMFCGVNAHRTHFS